MVTGGGGSEEWSPDEREKERDQERERETPRERKRKKGLKVLTKREKRLFVPACWCGCIIRWELCGVS